ncbi:hypothetical protein MKX54_09495 [Alkalihalobacillus sp. FSL R5-0424]
MINKLQLDSILSVPVQLDQGSIIHKHKKLGIVYNCNTTHITHYNKWLK